MIRELYYVYACSSHLRDTWFINTDNKIVDVICNVIEYEKMYDNEQDKGKLVSQKEEKENKIRTGVSGQVDPRVDIAPMGTFACDPT